MTKGSSCCCGAAALLRALLLLRPTSGSVAMPCAFTTAARIGWPVFVRIGATCSSAATHRRVTCCCGGGWDCSGRRVVLAPRVTHSLGQNVPPVAQWSTALPQYRTAPAAWPPRATSAPAKYGNHNEPPPRARVLGEFSRRIRRFYLLPLGGRVIERRGGHRSAADRPPLSRALVGEDELR